MNTVSTPYQTEQSKVQRDKRVPHRIALFTGAYNHIADGVSLTLNRVVSYLEHVGASVLVFAPTVEHPPVQHAGTLVPIPSVSVPGRPDYRISRGIPQSARDQLVAFRPTLFHIATPDYLGFRALKIAHKQRIPVVASYHTHFSSYLRYYGLHSIEDIIWKYLQWFYSHCEQVYVPSPSMESVLRSHGINNGLRLWERGVDTSLFNTSKRSPAWRQSLGIQDDEVVVSYVGRLVWEKGLHIVADVIENLNNRNIEFRSIIVGDGPALKELKQRLPDTVFTGYLKGEELGCAYASSDVFLFPSDTETFGNVTLEAMASGLPAVCADATGSNTLVEHGISGFLAPAGDSDAFLDAVTQLVSNPVLRQKMGARALENAETYEWEKVLSHIPRYYDEILNPGSNTSGDGYFNGNRLHESNYVVPHFVQSS